MKPTCTPTKQHFYLGLLICYVILFAAYANGRYAWTPLDDDAIMLTQHSANVYAEATLSPRSGAYPFGFAYPALNTFLAHATGLSIEMLQHLVQPFLVVILIPLGYVAFRSLTGSAATGLLAALLLFLQPEFLFEALRSSHAKITWAMAMLMLHLLARSFRAGGANRRFAVWVVLFYPAAFALITSNSFFASSYIFGIALAFVGSRVLDRLRRRSALVPPQLGRLWLVAVSCLVLAFIFIFYLYPPALNQFVTLRQQYDKLAALFLGVESDTLANPYAYVGGTWISIQVYLLVSSANWLILALSFVQWIHLGWQQWRGRALAPQALLLWLLYVAFALLLAVAVGLDIAGLLSANLQVRLFPHLMII